MSRTAPRAGALSIGALALLCAYAVPGHAVERDTFRVCADPNNLPYSNDRGQGFENKLAEIWAAKLGLSVEYTWFPQRMGFVRNTLRAQDGNGVYKCDVVMGIVEGYELLVTTKPYYRSSYALVYVKGRGLDDVETSLDLPRLGEKRRQALRIGTFAETPGAAWLALNGMIRQMVAYPVMSGDPSAYPGQLIEQHLLKGELDAAILWGPIAGYFATRADDQQLALLLLESEDKIKFDFAISAGVRFGETAAKKEIESLIDATREQIDALLSEYHIPRLELSEAQLRSAPDDDDDD